MVELLKLAMEKPLHAIVTALCAAVISLHIGQVTIGTAIAAINEQQINSKHTDERVIQMVESIARIDENVNIIKRQQEQQIKPAG